MKPAPSAGRKASSWSDRVKGEEDDGAEAANSFAALGEPSDELEALSLDVSRRISNGGAGSRWGEAAARQGVHVG
jgi:hypothetical protein